MSGDIVSVSNDIGMSDVRLTDTAGAAKLLGLSESRIKALDPILKPIRFTKKRIRIYDVARLETFAAHRDATKG